MMANVISSRRVATLVRRTNPGDRRVLHLIKIWSALLKKPMPAAALPSACRGGCTDTAEELCRPARVRENPETPMVPEAGSAGLTYR